LNVWLFIDCIEEKIMPNLSDTPRLRGIAIWKPHAIPTNGSQAHVEHLTPINKGAALLTAVSLQLKDDHSNSLGHVFLPQWPYMPK
jgi:hypothetical protein